MSSHGNDNVLFGGDEKAKARSKSGSKASKPGVVSVNEDNNADEVLFGKEREKSKSYHKSSSSRSRSSKGDSKRSSHGSSGKSRSERSHRKKDRPSSSSQSRSSGRSHRSRSRDSDLSEDNDAVLFGGKDDDAKAKEKAARGGSSRANKPGVERVTDSKPLQPGDKGYVADPLFRGAEMDRSGHKAPFAASGATVVGSAVLATEGETSSEEEAKQKKKKKKKEQAQKSNKKWYILIIVVLLLVGGGVGAFFALSGKKDKDTTTTPSGEKGPTNAPVSPPISDGKSPTNSPTEPPSKLEEDDVDSPSEEVCKNIAKNETDAMDGQDNVEQTNFAVTVDVTLAPGTDLGDQSLQSLMSDIQRLLIPQLAGCEIEDLGRKLLRVGGKQDYHQHDRQLDQSRGLREIIGAFVNSQVGFGEACTVTNNAEACKSLLIDLVLFHSENKSFEELRSMIEDVFSGNIVQSLKLAEPFRSIMKTDVSRRATDPPMTVPTLTPNSEAPVESPTDAPGDGTTPTDAPVSTPSPTKTPTLAPVVGETPAPTTAPTTSPTKFPTLAPVVGPTLPPTPQETPEPTPGPTPEPTPGPTPDPTPDPTPEPTPGPTPEPTPEPTPTPPPTPEPTPPPTPPPTYGCFCTSNSCNGSESGFEIGCGACIGERTCFGISRSGDDADETPSIGRLSCLGPRACEGASIDHIGSGSCKQEKACFGRNSDIGENSCSGKMACAATGQQGSTGLASVDDTSCIGTYSCFSQVVEIGEGSCKEPFACAGRAHINVGVGACTRKNSCSGAVFNDFNQPPQLRQTQESFFLDGSCTCEKCCTCMVRVRPGRCTQPGECCRDDGTKADDDTLDVIERFVDAIDAGENLEYLFQDTTIYLPGSIDDLNNDLTTGGGDPANSPTTDREDTANSPTTDEGTDRY